ncbi:MAG: DNA topoisomerase, partial [Oscillospiraceae bacterium]
RIILKQAENKKPVYRLWLPDQTEATILSALTTLEDDKKYDPLAFEGFTRMFVDWNYGINLSRYASLKSGTLIRVGRVISAIVKAVYDRDMEIRNFVPTKYFVLASNEETNGEVVSLVSSKKFKSDDILGAQSLADVYNSNVAKVIDKKTTRKTVQSPKLFSQSNLQNELSKRFNYAPDETLNLVQSLYEKGLVSYPRTPTEYLATAEKDKVKSIISLIDGLSGNLIFKDKKNIFDDSKIESHSAIIPTTKIASKGSFSSEAERNCYLTIYNRFRSVFCKEDCLEDQTILQISVGDLEVFKLKGNVPVQRGWKQFEGKADNEKLLPKLEIGDIVNIKFAPIEKETTPKSHFTVETLNNYLKNPFSDEVAAVNDDKEYAAMLNGLEIGTEATRPGIILTAINSNYIQLNKKTYTICPTGEAFIATMEKLQIDMTKEKTVFMGKQLKDVYKGVSGSRSVLAVVNAEISDTINKNITIPRVYDNSGSTVIGKCPKCGKPFYDAPKLGVCSDPNCDCKIWKTVAKKELTATMIKQLLTKGETKLIKGFTNKKGTL